MVNEVLIVAKKIDENIRSILNDLDLPFRVVGKKLEILKDTNLIIVISGFGKEDDLVNLLRMSKGLLLKFAEEGGKIVVLPSLREIEWPDLASYSWLPVKEPKYYFRKKEFYSYKPEALGEEEVGNSLRIVQPHPLLDDLKEEDFDNLNYTWWGYFPLILDLENENFTKLVVDKEHPSKILAAEVKIGEGSIFLTTIGIDLIPRLTKESVSVTRRFFKNMRKWAFPEAKEIPREIKTIDFNFRQLDSETRTKISLLETLKHHAGQKLTLNQLSTLAELDVMSVSNTLNTLISENKEFAEMISILNGEVYLHPNVRLNLSMPLEEFSKGTLIRETLTKELDIQVKLKYLFQKLREKLCDSVEILSEDIERLDLMIEALENGEKVSAIIFPFLDPNLLEHALKANIDSPQFLRLLKSLTSLVQTFNELESVNRETKMVLNSGIQELKEEIQTCKEMATKYRSLIHESRDEFETVLTGLGGDKEEKLTRMIDASVELLAERYKELKDKHPEWPPLESPYYNLSRVYEEEIMKNIGPIFPDYEERSIACIANTISYILGLGTPFEGKIIKRRWIDKNLSKIKRILLISIDGLGYKQFIWNREVLGKDMFLFRLFDKAKVKLLTVLTSSFPSETATAFTCIGTGSKPSLNGILGKRFRVETGEEGTIVNVITSAPRSQESIGDEVKSIAPQKTMFDVVDEHGILSRIFYPAKWPIYRKSHEPHWNYLSYMACGLKEENIIPITDGEIVRYLNNLREALKDLFKEPKFLAHIYVPYIDAMAGTYGPFSPDESGVFKRMNSYLEKILNNRDLYDGKTLLIVTADHGLCEVGAEQIDLEMVPSLSEFVQSIAYNERMAHLYLKNKDDLERVVKLLKGSKFRENLLILYKEDDLERVGLLERNRKEGRCGDIVVAIRTKTRFRKKPPEKEFVNRGAHGSLTYDEILVPCIIIRLDREIFTRI